jgi:hypothetical protein
MSVAESGVSQQESPSFLTKYGLAVCCIVAPLVFGYFAPNFIADQLMPFGKKDSPLQYLFSDTDTGAPTALDRQGRQASAGARAIAEAARIEAAKAEVAKSEIANDPTKLKAAREALAQLEAAGSVKEISRINQQSKYIAETLAGRYGYVAATGFLYVVAAATLLFAGSIVAAAGRLPLLVGGLIVFSGVAWIVAILPTAYENGGRLLLEQLFDKADESGIFDTLRAAQTDQNFKISSAIHRLVLVNTFVGLLSVGLALLAFGVLAVRADVSDLARGKLEKRLMAMRGLIFLSSLILVVATFASKVLLDWPLKLVAENQAKVLQPLAAALTTHLGVTGTIALFAAVVPAVVAYSIDVSRLSEEKGAPAAAGLDFAPSSMMAAFVAIVAPAMTSPVFNGLQSALTAFGKA